MKAIIESVTNDRPGWAAGVVRVGRRAYRFEAKHYETGSEYGISRGRVSKLRISDDCGRVACSYDRGWDVRPSAVRKGDMAAYTAILERYN